MLDLTGPQRPWPAALVSAFGDSQANALRTQGAWGPPRSGGDVRLINRLVELFDVPTDRVCITSGVRGFAAAWADSSRTMLVEAPGFTPLPAILGASGKIRRGDWNELFTVAEEAEKPLSLWLTSPGRNPDGRSMSTAESTRLRALARKGHHVVVNQVYRWHAAELPSSTHVWTVNSLSKVSGGGSRLGWATFPPDATLPVALTQSGPATIWQRTWADFLSPATWQTLLRQCVEPTTEARLAFVERLRENLGWYPDGAGDGVSVLLRVDGISESQMVERFRAESLRVSPGASFDAPHPSVRIAFSGVSAEQADRAAECVTRFASSLPSLTPDYPASQGC